MSSADTPKHPLNVPAGAPNAGRPTAPSKVHRNGPRIGVSASFFHADPTRAIFKGKTLAYGDQDLTRWLMTGGALPYLIPSPQGVETRDGYAHYAADLDGLLLQGGSDVAPETYGETPLDPRWGGDRIRDLYEMDLMQAFMAAGKPILGICRGIQLINVALGGTLFQDIETQISDAFTHRNWELYDNNTHTMQVEPAGWLAALYPGTQSARICSVHHQSLKDIGRDLVVEARAATDGVIEAVSHTGANWIKGVQWHPEWHRDSTPEDPHREPLLDSRPLLNDFLAACQKSAP